jgi:hypothetical protein
MTEYFLLKIESDCPVDKAVDMVQKVLLNVHDGLCGPDCEMINLKTDIDIPVLQDYYDAGLECIFLAPFMYDGCLVDLHDNIKYLSEDEAKERASKIHKLTKTLGDVIGELGFERGMLYELKHKW